MSHSELPPIPDVVPAGTVNLLAPERPGAAFDDFLAGPVEQLAAGRVDELSDFGRAPGMPQAHPTVEHYTPLFIALGAATDPSAAPRTVIDDFQMGLAKRSLEFA
jgi:4,5-DOPA dioxygenase extradiol